MAKQTICDNCGETVPIQLIECQLEHNSKRQRFLIGIEAHVCVDDEHMRKADLCLNCIKSGVASGKTPDRPTDEQIEAALKKAFSRAFSHLGRTG